jgi:hypothetical protein
MSSADDLLRRWRDAGLIDEPTAERIRAFEAKQDEPATPDRERPGVVEALLYLGVAVLVAGVSALISEQWGSLQSWARVAAPGMPAVLAVLVGLYLRSTERPAFVRAGQVVWMVSVALIAGTIAIASSEYDFAQTLGMGERTAMVVLALMTVLVAFAFWVFEPSHAQVLAIGASWVFLGTSVGNWPDEYGTQISGMLFFGAGAGGLIATEVGRFEPRLSARFLFAGFTVFGCFIASVDGNAVWAELLTIAVSSGLVALSVRRDSLTFMAIGVVGVFVGLLTIIFAHFAERIGAPAALILSGAVLIAGVLVGLQLQSRIRPEETS